MEYARLKGKLRAEDPRLDKLSQAAIVLDAPPFLLSGHARGLRN